MIKTETVVSNELTGSAGAALCGPSPKTAASSTSALRPMTGFIHQAIYYPLGFPLRVVSNSARILDAAEESWSCFKPMFQSEPLELQIGVKKNRGLDELLPPEPVDSLIGNLLVNSADADNFFVVNLAKGRTIGWVTEAAACSQLYLRYFYLEAAALAMISTLRAVPVHGACVLVRNTGILLCGDSGVGKSTLAYAGARSGWTYLSDDASYVLLDSEDSTVVGNCHKIRFRPSATELFPEVEGRPVTPRAFGKPSIEVRMSEWPEICTTPVATVSQIIFLNRTNAQQELVSLSPSEVTPWFMRHVLPTTSLRTTPEATLSRLLKSTIHELRYCDLTWAIERINQLAEQGR
jgi:hypothetical protein